MKKQCYMTAGERHQLEAMRRNHIPISEIARQLNRSRQTIYNELRRGSYLHTVDYRASLSAHIALHKISPDRAAHSGCCPDCPISLWNLPRRFSFT